MDYLSAALFLFGSLGVINGLLLGSFLLFNGRHRPSSVYFGGLLLAICIRIGKSIIVQYDRGVDKLVLQIGLSACIFIGPLFYLYLRTKIRKERSLQRQDLLALLILGLFVVVGGALYPYRTYPLWWNDFFIHVIYFVWAFFALWGLFEARYLLGRVWKDPRELSAQDRYLVAVILGMLFISCTYFFALYIQGFTYLWGSLIFTSVFYYLMIAELRLRFGGRRQASNPLPQPVNGKDLLQELDELISSQQLHRNAKLKLADLAAAAGWTSHQLSRVLNERYPHGFAHYINEKRVADAQQLMLEADHLSLEGIGYEAGFNSKSSFYATFRKHTGLTPAQFKRKAQGDKKTKD